MTREENLHWIDQEIKTWENECQSKHPIKEALYAARKALEQEPCEDAVSRKSVITIIQNHWWNCRDIDKLVNELPPVTPQEPMVEIDLYSVIKQKYIEREVLDKIRAEIEKQEKWLLQAGYNAYNVDIAFNSIKLALAESEGE